MATPPNEVRVAAAPMVRAHGHLLLMLAAAAAGQAPKT